MIWDLRSAIDLLLEGSRLVYRLAYSNKEAPGVEVGHAPGTRSPAEWLSKWRRQKNFDHRLNRQFLHLHPLVDLYLLYLIINPSQMKSRTTFQASVWLRSWFSFFRLASAHRDVRRENTCHIFSLFTNQHDHRLVQRIKRFHPNQALLRAWCSQNQVPE
jgi:hypothetical protein